MLEEKEKQKEKKPFHARFHRKKTVKDAAPGKEPAQEAAKAPQEKSAAAKNPSPQRKKPRQGGSPARTAGADLQKATAQKKSAPQKKKGGHKKRPLGKLRIASLGGLHEIGKNMTMIEYENDIIVVDCGIAFPDEDMLGIDLVIPDVTYLEKNKDKIRGILLTHGHEDHIGSLPYVLRQINPDIYGTKLTLGIVERKLAEHRLPEKPKLHAVEAGDTVSLGALSAEFIRVNHSIADACAIAIRTPLGTLIHSGDFKLDLTPIDGKMMDVTRLGELGNEGVLLLMCESTNAERPGFTPSEKKVGASLADIFMKNTDKRIVIATFSSNVHRVQQIISLSAKNGRKVAVLGRSMVGIIEAAAKLGYMDVPEGVLIDVKDVKRYPPSKVTLVTTGSQGEPMSALYRLAFGENDRLSLGADDLVVISATAIPGNEKSVSKIINALIAGGVSVMHDPDRDVHVSGHACREELKLMHALTRPKYFMPIHGELRHLDAHRAIAMEMGTPSENIFVSEIGKVLEIDESGARFNGTVPSGKTLVDGYGVGDVGSIVLRDRKHLSQDGLIVVVAAVDEEARLLLSGPDIISRGFVYVRDSEELMGKVRAIATDAIEKALERRGSDRMDIKTAIKDNLTKYLFQQLGRKPMILPVLMDFS